MKTYLSLSGVNQTLDNLKQAGIIIPHNFKAELVKYGKDISKKAKEILEQKSAIRTNKQYWTGKLQKSIKVNILEREDEMVGISVGPDMREAPYAEWVEIGHFVHGGWYGEKGAWWEGYHYMEGAYAEIAPEIPDNISKTLKTVLNNFAQSVGRIRHKRTGRFVSGVVS